MNRHLWTIACGVAALALMLCLAAPAAAQNPYAKWKFDEISFDPPMPERFELPNGMVVYFLPDRQLPVVTISVLLHAGEAYVPADKTGLAAITGEALVTGGTKSRTPDQVDEELEFRGIQWSGSIEMESGEFSMQCLSRDFETALSLLSDLLINPAFEASRLQLAIDNTLEDIRRQNDSPGRISRREYARLVYGDHPYGRSPSEKTVSAVTRQDVMDFYRSYFHPNRCILALSGDLDAAALKGRLEKAFSGWPRGEGTLPVIPDPAPPQPGVYQIDKDISQTNLRFGHLGIDRHNPDRHALRVLNHILGGGGFTSRMMGKVRSDSGWAYSVGTAFGTSDKAGLFVAACETKSETTTKALALMQWVIADLRDNGIRDEELTTAKESIINSDVFNYDTPVDVVENYAWLEFHGFPPDQLKRNLETIRAVTRADVEAVARKYLDPSRYVVVAVGKIAAFDAPLDKFGPVTTLTLEPAP